MKIVVVGGVAGGASCAARARRMCEKAEILMLDRGPYVSFANCGLPYYVGDVIRDESKLLVADAELFKKRFNIEVRTRHEVTGIDRARRRITVKDLAAGTDYEESYDALVLSPGAAALRPPLPGIDLPGIFSVRTIPDSRRIREWIAAKQARRAVIIGAGFIGLEMAENLHKRGLAVTLVEMAHQVLPPIDPEMAWPVQNHLEQHGVSLILGDGVAGFEGVASGGLQVTTQSGRRLGADLVILALGVVPETRLAREAGLDLGERGGIRVDDQMRTNDPHIWAVGDAVEVRDTVTGAWLMMPLAGPANRQGRIAADVICGRDVRFRGVQGTAICGVFDLAVACTGASEKTLRRAGRTDFEKIYLHPGHHVGYYPGAKPIHLKLLFRRDDGLVLGAQAVGEADVDRKVDVLAMAIQQGMTVYDLEESELCYAPQFGAAKDPVNMAGMIAANHLRGDLPLARWEALSSSPGVILDVRDPDEYAAGHVPGARNIPLTELRDRAEELPRDEVVRVYCGVGQRSYYATRLLLQRGYAVQNLSGGYRTYLAFRSLGGVP